VIGGAFFLSRARTVEDGELPVLGKRLLKSEQSSELLAVEPWEA
jgi:hypothetical protein